jgi:cardiolipin-specific phospholipase
VYIHFVLAFLELQCANRRLPFFRPEKLSSQPNSPDSPVIAHSSRIDLTTPKHYINTLTLQPTLPSPSAPPPVCVVHGYGAGLGFFFQNFPTLAKWAGKRGTNVYALDWLGMGRSARVPFVIKAKREDIEGRVTEAESFFIDSLEEWRLKMGLEKMTLVGHSLGAYFSVVYALRYPARVSKLILLSPAGVLGDPDTTAIPSKEFTDKQVNVDDAHGSAEPATKGKVEGIKSAQRVEKRQESKTRKLLMYLWEEGWSPFQLARSMTVFAPLVIGKASVSSEF